MLQETVESTGNSVLEDWLGQMSPEVKETSLSIVSAILLLLAFVSKRRLTVL